MHSAWTRIVFTNSPVECEKNRESQLLGVDVGATASIRKNVVHSKEFSGEVELS